MEHGAFALAQQLQAGTPLVEACEAAAERLSEAERQDFAPKLGGWFRLWGNRGWVVDIRIDGTSIA